METVIGVGIVVVLVLLGLNWALDVRPEDFGDY
jgi:hypothetical protein